MKDKKLNDKIIITTGDPNGIGAEVTLKALDELKLPKDSVILVSNRKVVGNVPYELVEIPLEGEIEPGRLSAEAGEFCFQSLKMACELAKMKTRDQRPETIDLDAKMLRCKDAKKNRSTIQPLNYPTAIVTAPVSKAALHLAGHKFNGQTEVLEHFLAHDGQKAEMLFVADNFRVFLLTRHISLKEVTLTREMVEQKILNLSTFQSFNHSALFALCGLNPHAGEDGILGREEIDILIPAVKNLRAKGINITDPLPADTLFADYAKYDCIIACYHDQGLIPIKTLCGQRVVNTTIGLDVLRTSPPHGTAFDIAGKNMADPTGMIEAIKLALSLVR